MTYCSSSCVCSDLNTRLNLIDPEIYTIIKETMGILSAITSAVLFIPDVIITYRTRGEKSHNFNFLFIFLIGAIFWLIYGILIYSISTIILEIFLIINILIISFIKCANKYIKYKKQELEIVRILEVIAN